MSALIGIYYGSPTAGGTDGTRASEGTELTPIIVGPLDTAANDISANFCMAIRCDSGYVTGNDTTITPTGTTADMWALAPTSGNDCGTFGNWGAALTFSSAIPDSNVLFWGKAKAASTETPTNDTSVDLVIAATISPE